MDGWVGAMGLNGMGWGCMTGAYTQLIFARLRDDFLGCGGYVRLGTFVWIAFVFYGWVDTFLFLCAYVFILLTPHNYS